MKKIFNFIKRNSYLFTIIILMVIIGTFVIGITFAYYSIAGVGETTSTMKIGGASVTATFTSSNYINIDSAVPSSSAIATKDYSVTIKNTSSQAYKIYMKANITNNTFTDTTNDGVLYYEIKSGSDYSTTVKAKTMFPTIAKGKSILAEISVPANTNTTTNYRLYIYFPTSTKIQNKNGNLTLSSTILIESNNSTAYLDSSTNSTYFDYSGGTTIYNSNNWYI